MVVSRTVSLRPYGVVVAPLPSSSHFGFTPKQAAAVAFISDPETQPLAKLELLRSLFRLSKKEAELAAKVSVGEKLSVAAAALGITYETARTYLKSAFAKLGVSRQTELARLLEGLTIGAISSSLRPERLVQHLLHRPRTRLRERRRRKTGLRHRLAAGFSVCDRQRLRQQRLEAQIVGEMLDEIVAWVRDARFPTRTPLACLIAPFQQVQKEDRQSAHKLALLRPPHAVDFLGDVLDVGLRKLTPPQELRLLAAPGVKIAVVKRATRRHGERIRRLAALVHAPRPPRGNMQNAVLFVATVLIWGATWIAIKMQVGSVPVLVSIFYRFVIAALAVIGALAVSGKLAVPARRHHPWLVAQAVCLFSMNFVCFYNAAAFITSGLVSVIFSLATVYNTINGRVFFGDRITGRALVAAALGAAPSVGS